MTPFVYERASNTQAALASGARAGAKYLGGGTNLVDLMRETIERPGALIDVTVLSGQIEDTSDGGLKIGAGVTNTAVVENRQVRERYPLLARAILSGASAQIRNMATVGGNVLQRTRCSYFYDDAAACNKRSPGQGCDAIGGFNRYHAILGASPDCIATHPSDMCVALAALDAVIVVDGPDGTRNIPIANFHRLPGGTPDIETELTHGELVTAIVLPPNGIAGHSTYRKIRDRASYAFALVSVAAGIMVEDGAICDVRIALGGVAAKPWRCEAAEAILRNATPARQIFADAAEAELAAARGLAGNAFKVELARRVIVDSLVKLTRIEETA